MLKPAVKCPETGNPLILFDAIGKIKLVPKLGAPNLTFVIRWFGWFAHRSRLSTECRKSVWTSGIYSAHWPYFAGTYCLGFGRPSSRPSARVNSSSESA